MIIAFRPVHRRWQSFQSCIIIIRIPFNPLYSHVLVRMQCRVQPTLAFDICNMCSQPHGVENCCLVQDSNFSLQCGMNCHSRMEKNTPSNALIAAKLESKNDYLELANCFRSLSRLTTFSRIPTTISNMGIINANCWLSAVPCTI